MDHDKNIFSPERSYRDGILQLLTSLLNAEAYMAEVDAPDDKGSPGHIHVMPLAVGTDKGCIRNGIAALFAGLHAGAYDVHA